MIDLNKLLKSAIDTENKLSDLLGIEEIFPLVNTEFNQELKWEVKKLDLNKDYDYNFMYDSNRKPITVNHLRDLPFTLPTDYSPVTIDKYTAFIDRSPMPRITIENYNKQRLYIERSYAFIYSNNQATIIYPDTATTSFIIDLKRDGYTCDRCNALVPSNDTLICAPCLHNSYARNNNFLHEIKGIEDLNWLLYYPVNLTTNSDQKITYKTDILEKNKEQLSFLLYQLSEAQKEKRSIITEKSYLHSLLSTTLNQCLRVIEDKLSRKRNIIDISINTLLPLDLSLVYYRDSNRDGSINEVVTHFLLCKNIPEEIRDHVKSKINSQNDLEISTPITADSLQEIYNRLTRDITTHDTEA